MTGGRAIPLPHNRVAFRTLVSVSVCRGVFAPRLRRAGRSRDWLRTPLRVRRPHVRCRPMRRRWRLRDRGPARKVPRETRQYPKSLWPVVEVTRSELCPGGQVVGSRIFPLGQLDGRKLSRMPVETVPQVLIPGPGSGARETLIAHQTVKVGRGLRRWCGDRLDDVCGRRHLQDQ